MKKDPIDFLPIEYSKIARDRNKYHNIPIGDRLLFSNHTVPLGDRVAVVMKKFKTDIVPKP